MKNRDQYPTLLKRVQALFIDTFVVLIVFVAAAYLIDFIGAAPNWTRALIFIFMLFLYEPILIALTGGTIGHHFMSLKVKKVHDNDKNIWILAAFLRFFLKWLLGWLSFITISFNDRKRAIHDLGSNSLVLIDNE